MVIDPHCHHSRAVITCSADLRERAAWDSWNDCCANAAATQLWRLVRLKNSAERTRYGAMAGAALALAASASLVAACGGAEDTRATPAAPGSFAPAPGPAPPADATAAPEPRQAAPSATVVERLDRREERANDTLERAARSGDRRALAAAERALDRAARRADAARTAEPSKPAADPLQRLLVTFPYKQAPLFVQQTTLSGELEDHRLFVSVVEEHFCLKTRRRKLAAVQATFRSIDRFMREHGVTDLELVVAPLIGTGPTLDDALAIGRDGAVRLTTRGRAC